MKLKINKKIRLGIIIIIVIITIIFAYFIYYEAYNPNHEDQIASVYSYSNKSSINYAVYLKPNNLYIDNKLVEEKLYITEFVDYIDATLNYELIGDKPADIKGEYNISAKVQGFTGEGEKLINIWEKDFPIKQYQYFNSNDGKVLIKQNVKLNISEYNAFVNEIKESSKINCETSITLFMDVKLSGTYENRTFEESASPSIVIPLDVNMFNITKNNIFDKPGAIEETIQTKLPINKNLIIILGIIILLLLTALIILVFFIQNAPEKDKHEKELKKIFKKYGDRLVAINTNMIIEKTMALSSDTSIKNPISVNSFDDIVRISDELSKPIFYKYSDNYKEINKFFVSNGVEKFIYNIPLIQQNHENQAKDKHITSDKKINIKAKS